MNSTPRAWHVRRLLGPVLIAALACAAFLPALGADFVNWDDEHNFLNNPHYRGLAWANLRWMFTNFREHYIPLTWMTLGADYLVWGMNPAGYHATSLLLHGLNAVLFFFVAQGILRRAAPGAPPAACVGASVTAALWFALHPLRAESVAWITERRDVLSGIFFLSTVLAYLRMVEEPPRSPGCERWRWVSAGLFACMILSKAMGMTLPLALLVLDAYPLRRISREPIGSLLREKAPHFALMIGATILTAFTQRSVGSLHGIERYPLVESLAQPGYRISFYVSKMLVPVHLSPLYLYRPQIGVAQALGWLAVASGTGILWALRKRLPSGLAAWAAFLVLISPVSGVLQTGDYFAADRYTYLAGLPAALLVGGAALAVWARSASAAGILATVGLALLGFLSWRQTAFWKDSQTLWTQAIRVDPECFLAYYQRGTASLNLGNPIEAIRDFDQSLKFNPRHALSYMNRATAKLNLGDFVGAILDYDQCLEMSPEHEKAWNSRGFARERMGDLVGARADYDRALEINPGYLLARTNRGTLRKRQNDLDGAWADAEGAIRDHPESGAGYVLRASLYRLRGESLNALADLDRALALAPGSVEALNNRASIYLQLGKPEAAVQDYDRALRVNPDHASILVNRGQARLAMGDRSGAATDFQRALKAAPPDWPLRSDVEAMLRRAAETK